jgi:Zn-dependent protease
MINLSLALMFQDLLPGFARINLVLGLFNLLPFKSSDGYRILNCLTKACATMCARQSPPT